jgi:hypothetical protein
VVMWRTVPVLLAFSLLFFLIRTRKLGTRLGLAAAAVVFLALAGCSGHSTPPHIPTGGTPKGTSTLTVTGTSGSLTSSATVALTVN